MYTDEHKNYVDVTDFKHDLIKDLIKHYAGEYVEGKDVHTNGAEFMRSILKRSIFGTWQQVSVKRLGRYVNEVMFRLNEGSVKHRTPERVASLFDLAFETRIIYKL